VSDALATFFSYSRDDSEFALRLAEDLKAAGANVWIDQLDIPAGMPWDRMVEDALNSCPHILVILSPISVKSDHVRDEVSFALSKQKRVIPVLYRECDVPFRMARLQHIDFRPDYARGLKLLLKALGVGHSPQPLAEKARLEQEECESKAAAEKARLKPEEAFSGDQAQASGKVTAQPAPGSRPGSFLSLGSGKELLTLDAHTDSVNCVAWSLDGNRLATGSEDATAKIWGAETGRELLTLHAQSGIRSVAWNSNPDEIWLATASNNEIVTIWNAVTGEQEADEAGNGCVLAWRPGGYWLAMSGEKTGLCVRDLSTGERLPIRDDHPFVSLAWSPDGKLLAAGTWDTDKLVRVWDADSGRQLLSLKAHDGGIYSLSWSPDGYRLATASNEGAVKVWDARSGKRLLTVTLAPQGAWNEVWAVAWCPGGKWVATGTQDGAPRVWDAESGEQCLTLREHGGAVKGVAWSPDGKRLATGSEDNTAKVWDVGSQLGL